MMLISKPMSRSWFCALALVFICCACSTPPAPPKPDEPPVASAGPDQDVPLGTLVTLDGSSSADPDGQVLSYTWSADQDNPMQVVLTSTSIVRFTPTLPGQYTFILVVTAGAIASTPDSLQLNVTGGDNNAPIAQAGPDYAAALGNSFFLDASASTDSDGDSLSFLWEALADPGVVSIADSASAQTQITPLLPGTYTFLLRVSDGVTTSTDDITVLVTSEGNVAPVANAGVPQTVAVGTPVVLDGSGSLDADGDTLAYRWFVGNNPGEPVALSDSTAVSPDFVPNLLGTYVFGLIVDDGSSASLLDTTAVTVVAQVYAKRSGMIEIPGGPFRMGSEAGLAGETPVHTVDVSTFWIDSTEVAAAQYSLCVNDAGCTTPTQRTGCTFGLNERANHPINCVDFDQAAAFCAWADKRLPTEAEWEKAARGPNDERRFPWGDDDPNFYLISFPEARLLNYNNITGETHPVGQHPDGVSPFGVHNMAGNVMEWVTDWYDPVYYDSSPSKDPSGPSSGEQRVARGGHFLGSREVVTVSVRNRTQPSTRDPILGFRCASTLPPP
jgi:formylglycine-generating enzyme required for sulfatase activity